VAAPEPLAITDVHYTAVEAFAACIVAARWTDHEPIEQQCVRLSDVRPYQSGRFYLRELPCLLQVLARVSTAFAVLVIDGYVELDAGTPGLGAHLYEQLGARVPVIGIAKSAYRGSEFAQAVLRGRSRRPLFVTARGIPEGDAARAVAEMHGAHRIPTLIALADRRARLGQAV
jgi:deoxyribonuclease V